jgi:hypothetical protein
MPPIENNAAGEHQRSVKDIDKGFFALQIAIAPLHVFGHTVGRSDHYQNTDCVENLHIAIPRDFGDHHLVHRSGEHATMEDYGDDYKEPEEDDLDKEAGDDHVFA